MRYKFKLPCEVRYDKIVIDDKKNMLDLSTSNYFYSTDNITFFFSKELYKHKFIKNREQHLDYINYSLSKRFKFIYINNDLSDIILYDKIEKNGFCFKFNNNYITDKNIMLYFKLSGYDYYDKLQLKNNILTTI